MVNGLESSEKRIYTVSELTQSIKSLLESSFPFIWLFGEISNLRVPASQHAYFTLKDSAAQISAVMFRGQARNLKFDLEDGISVIAMGRLSLYEPRGTYQIIVELIEPKGLGALQQAFDQLKSKLEEQGLFRAERKRALPFLPKKIAAVTSPTGAVIRDIISVLYRRFPRVALEIVPVRVQGEGAAEEISQAIEIINKKGDADVIILARGGGSLEDFQAFNSEVVARAIYESAIPVVSGVGHETDFTIADFTADVRAPTPSAAAEMVVPVLDDLVGLVNSLRRALMSGMFQKVERLRERHLLICQRLVHPGRRVGDWRLRLDDAFQRVVRGFARMVDESGQRVQALSGRLLRCSPSARVDDLNLELKHYDEKLRSIMRFCIRDKTGRFLALAGKLSALNPLAILERGYSITRRLPDYRLLRDSGEVHLGQEVEVTLWRGSLECRVEGKKKNGKTDF